MKKFISLMSFIFSLACNAQVCGGSNRPQINAQLVPIGTLSQTRHGIAVASAGNKILFAGGYDTTGSATHVVDIYNVITQTWTPTSLSFGRCYMAAVANANKIFFAGGTWESGGGIPFNIVDIYDVTANIWSTASLSIAGYCIAAAAVGEKVLFAGGYGAYPGTRSSMVDIYDLQTNGWSTLTLPSVKREGHAAVTINNKVYFAGGFGPALPAPGNGYVSDTVDIYDNATNSWAASTMLEPKSRFAGIATGNNIYWAGGYTGNYSNSSCLVEINDVINSNVTREALSVPDTWSNFDGQNAVEKDGKIILPNNHFATNYFDIYDVATNTWSIGVLPVNISGASIIAVNNEIYIAGGVVNGALSNQVYKLEFNIALPMNLLNFSAEVVRQTIKIKWQTENERNIQNYIIQRSVNGNNFYDIGKAKSLNIPGSHSYSFIVQLPLETINYYRLRIEDKDGRFTYSHILPVKTGKQNDAITVYPNPAIGAASILFNSKAIDKYSIHITDITGRIMSSLEGITTPGLNTINVDVTKYNSGIYLIILHQEQKKQIVKFIKE